MMVLIVFSAQPQLLGAWKTAAIVREVAREVEIMNSPMMRSSVEQLVYIEQLIKDGQVLSRIKEVADALKDLKDSRNKHRKILLEGFNKHFGSMSRTYNSRTMFLYNVARYSDFYTSSVTNMLKYPLDCMSPLSTP